MHCCRWLSPFCSSASLINNTSTKDTTLITLFWISRNSIHSTQSRKIYLSLRMNEVVAPRSRHRRKPPYCIYRPNRTITTTTTTPYLFESITQLDNHFNSK